MKPSNGFPNQKKEERIIYYLKEIELVYLDSSLNDNRRQNVLDSTSQATQLVRVFLKSPKMSDTVASSGILKLE
ncbi:hypothetical protein PS6_006616 [Mucor atramentarius]